METLIELKQKLSFDWIIELVHAYCHQLKKNETR